MTKTMFIIQKALRESKYFPTAQLICIAINCMQMVYRIAIAQLEIFFEREDGAYGE